MHGAAIKMSIVVFPKICCFSRWGCCH